ncbi:hypothetical protein A9Q90_07445 [Gammaproteobacteria bacterium 54_18_T64]|nr:hypothetical protein A9Q90_07445 [Gammaproteobacteria bacterium 54_18_T64]
MTRASRLCVAVDTYSDCEAVGEFMQSLGVALKAGMTRAGASLSHSPTLAEEFGIAKKKTIKRAAIAALFITESLKY